MTRASVYMQPPIDGQAHIKEVVRKMISQAQKVSRPARVPKRRSRAGLTCPGVSGAHTRALSPARAFGCLLGCLPPAFAGILGFSAER